jgi:hypothetical protein
MGFRPAAWPVGRSVEAEGMGIRMSSIPCPTAPKIAAIVNTMHGDPDVVQFELRIINQKV